MNRRVSVWKYVRLKNGRWRYCKPAIGKNGKIRPDWVLVKGKAEHHPEGNFYLHRYDNGREIWRKIGESAQEAVDAADFEGTYLQAKSKGIPVKEINAPVLSIDAGVHGWLEEVKLSSRPETYELYEQTIREFQHWNSNGGARRVNIADLSRMHLLKYRMWLIENIKNSPHTAGNKLLRVSQWYRHVMKLKPGEGLVTVKDTRLGVTVREPEVYSEDELEKFFKACSHDESLLFRTYLLSGFREDEVRFLTWGDLDVEAGTLRVTAKPPAIVVLVIVVPVFLVLLPIFRWFTQLLIVIWFSFFSPFVRPPRPGLITAAEILTKGYDPEDFDFEQIDGIVYGRRRGA